MTRKKAARALPILVLTLGMALAFVLGTASRAYALDPVMYIDGNGNEVACETYETVQDTSVPTTWSNAWYVVPPSANVTVTSSIAIDRNVNLILCDGASLTVTGEITGEEASFLSTFAQSTGERMGKLVVNSSKSNGTSVDVQYVSFYGGDISVSAGTNSTAIEADYLKATGGKITATAPEGESFGIFGNHSLLMSGARITASGGSAGIACEGSFLILGGVVQADGGHYGLWQLTEDRDINIDGGVVTCEGGVACVQAAKLTLGEAISVWAGQGKDSASRVEDASTWDHTQKWAVFRAAHSHDSKDFEPWTSTSSLPTTSGNYYLFDDVTLTETWSVPEGIAISLCLNDKTIALEGEQTHIECGGRADAESSSQVTIYDDEGKGAITSDPTSARVEPIVTVGNDYTFIMNDGKLTGSSCGGVDVLAGGEFVLNGGIITGNSRDTYGAGVWVGQDGTLTMSGGTITGNKTSREVGGGVYVSGGDLVTGQGTLQISGNAQISDNQGSASESNVFLDRGVGVFRKHDPALDAKIVVNNPLSEQAFVGVAMEVPGVFTDGWGKHMPEADPTDHFTSDDPDYLVIHDGEELTLANEPEPAPTPARGHEMYRLYNPNSGEHFYTASPAERDNVVAAGWNDEGVGWIAPDEGAPVYRLYNKNGGEHHYTTSPAERKALIGAGWSDEGIGWKSAGTDGVPLYRQYNPNAFANNHNYTASNYERGVLVGKGWNDEGIAWYGLRVLK